LKQQVHQTLGKEGVIPELDYIWRGGGQQWLDDLRLGDVFVDRIESLRDLIDLYDREIHQCDARIHRRLKGDRGYEAVQALRGVGPVLAAVFVAEIGDVTRFDNPRRLCSWAGLTPRLRESDAHTQRGHITKQGSRLLRWAAVEAGGVIRRLGGWKRPGRAVGRRQEGGDTFLDIEMTNHLGYGRHGAAVRNRDNSYNGRPVREHRRRHSRPMPRTS
jgi:hypothetical protein